MATTFLEPGGDATFNVLSTTDGGFWQAATAVDLETDFVHGGHLRSINYEPGAGGDRVITPNSTLADAGSRISMYLYFVALPSATARIWLVTANSGTGIFKLVLTTGGVLQLQDSADDHQLGTNGSTLSTGVWYRISLAYTISSTTVNRFELFVNGVSNISVTNATLISTGGQRLIIGNPGANSTLDFRSSDHYIDDSSSLTDTGDVWVTAKRPNANGTTNGFTTQIGAGGSGYGSGHSPQVNERALSTTNGWSMIGAGSAVTEEYNIENKSTGDMNLSGTKIIDYVGWVFASALVSITAQIKVNGVSSGISLTSTNTMFTKVVGSTSYPAGTGTDIGIVTDTTLTTVSLYECGIMIAFNPAGSVFGNYPPYVKVGGGMSRNERAT